MYAVSDDDSYYEDGTEGDEASVNNVVDGASRSLDLDEPSFVDSQENLDYSSSDDESIG